MRDRKSHEERRRQILDAARKLCAEHGYAVMQIRDLMRETRLSRGGFYHHFSSKADVLRALVELEVAALVKRAGNDLVNLILLGSVHAGAKPGILGAVSEPEDRSDYVRFLDAAHDSQIGPMMIRAIEAGISAGRFHAVNAGHIAEMFLAVNGRINQKVLLGIWDETQSAAFAQTALGVFAKSLGEPDLFLGLFRGPEG